MWGRFHQIESTVHSRAESDRISGCGGGGPEPSTVRTRNNASGGVVVYGGETRGCEVGSLACDEGVRAAVVVR